MGLKLKIFFVSLIIIIAAVLGFLLFTDGVAEKIGENDLGYVTKVNYTHTDSPKAKIAVISGMHSRETLHLTVLPYVCRYFSITDPDVEIVNYRVKVTDSPEDFNRGRANGESVVHDIVVDDIAKSDYDLVIIGHDHELDYGEGYYIATPTMDNKSVKLAEKVSKDIGFNYYKRNLTVPAKSSSILNVDNPIVETGTRVFVYEMPETDSKTNGFWKSYSLLESSYNHLING